MSIGFIYITANLSSFAENFAGVNQLLENHLVQFNLVPEWYFYFFMFLLISFAVARIYLGPLSLISMNSVLRYNTTASLFKDNSQLQRQRDSVLYIFYFLSMGFYLMLLLQYYHLSPYKFTDHKLLLFTVLTLFFIFILRNLLLVIIGYIFNKPTLFREYLYHNFAFNKFMGIVFLPLSFVISYSEGVLQQATVNLSIAVLLILILLKFSRAIIFSFKKHVLNFYLFLYLCALEIVPILLLYKWFIVIV